MRNRTTTQTRRDSRYAYFGSDLGTRTTCPRGGSSFDIYWSEESTTKSKTFLQSMRTSIRRVGKPSWSVPPPAIPHDTTTPIMTLFPRASRRGGRFYVDCGHSEAEVRILSFSWDTRTDWRRVGRETFTITPLEPGPGQGTETRQKTVARNLSWLRGRERSGWRRPPKRKGKGRKR